MSKTSSLLFSFGRCRRPHHCFSPFYDNSRPHHCFYDNSLSTDIAPMETSFLFYRARETRSPCTITSSLRLTLPGEHGTFFSSSSYLPMKLTHALLRYLHERVNIIQRDLKGRNVLVDTSLNAKICDFGLSRRKNNDVAMTACGTPAWIAPEIVRMEKYTEKADVYSFSIVMWEIFNKMEPYVS